MSAACDSPGFHAQGCSYCDADRLAMIKSLGGQLIGHTEGTLWAVYDREFALIADGSVESRQPALTARTCDVKELAKDVVLDVGDESYRIKRQEPDGTGMSIVILKR